MQAGFHKVLLQFRLWVSWSDVFISLLRGTEEQSDAAFSKWLIHIRRLPRFARNDAGFIINQRFLAQ